MCVGVRACVYARVYVCVCVCRSYLCACVCRVRVCMCAYVRARVCVRVSVSVFA